MTQATYLNAHSFDGTYSSRATDAECARARSDAALSGGYTELYPADCAKRQSPVVKPILSAKRVALAVVAVAITVALIDGITLTLKVIGVVALV